MRLRLEAGRIDVFLLHPVRVELVILDARDRRLFGRARGVAAAAGRRVTLGVRRRYRQGGRRCAFRIHGWGGPRRLTRRDGD